MILSFKFTSVFAEVDTCLAGDDEFQTEPRPAAKSTVPPIPLLL